MTLISGAGKWDQQMELKISITFRTAGLTWGPAVLEV